MNIDNEEADFRGDLMDPLLIAVNLFSQKCAELLIKNPRLLALYFTMLSSSEHFCNFQEEEDFPNGMNKDPAGPGHDTLVKLGGHFWSTRSL